MNRQLLHKVYETITQTTIIMEYLFKTFTPERFFVHILFSAESDTTQEANTLFQEAMLWIIAYTEESKPELISSCFSLQPLAHACIRALLSTKRALCDFKRLNEKINTPEGVSKWLKSEDMSSLNS